MILHVTQEDLNASQQCFNNATEYICNSCPVAKALERTFGMKFWASRARLVPDRMYCDDYQSNATCSGYAIITPEEIRCFMEKWDENNHSVLPSSFEIPDEIAAKWTVLSQTGKAA